MAINVDNQVFFDDVFTSAKLAGIASGEAAGLGQSLASKVRELRAKLLKSESFRDEVKDAYICGMFAGYMEKREGKDWTRAMASETWHKRVKFDKTGKGAARNDRRTAMQEAALNVGHASWSRLAAELKLPKKDGTARTTKANEAKPTEDKAKITAGVHETTDGSIILTKVDGKASINVPPAKDVQDVASFALSMAESLHAYRNKHASLQLGEWSSIFEDFYTKVKETIAANAAPSDLDTTLQSKGSDQQPRQARGH